MWQSYVKIEGYSVTYFDRITAFKARYHWTFIKAELTSFVDSLDIHVSTKRILAPPLTEVQQYSASNTVLQSKYTME